MWVSWLIYLLWVASLALFCGCLIVDGKHGHFSWFTLLAILPLVTLAIFSYVFIFNRGSNVAQYSEPRHLWSLWFQSWSVLIVGNGLNALASVAALFVPRRRINSQHVALLKTAMAFSAGLSLFYTMITMPDA